MRTLVYCQEKCKMLQLLREVRKLKVELLYDLGM